jgi:hypothetical protein
MMKLQPYSHVFEKDCLSIFDSNVPVFFASEERETFLGFLKRQVHPYFYFIVRNTSEKIVACGGMKLEPATHSAMLRWDMVINEIQKQGIGTFLALSRLHLIAQNPDIQMVNLHTSQHSYRFYEKMGFVLQHMIPNGIVDGMDEYYMELNLSHEKIQELAAFAEQKLLTL